MRGYSRGHDRTIEASVEIEPVGELTIVSGPERAEPAYRAPRTCPESRPAARSRTVCLPGSARIAFIRAFVYVNPANRMPQRAGLVGQTGKSDAAGG